MSNERRKREPLQLSLFHSETRNASWVANYLKTSPQTVGRLIEQGMLRAYQLTPGGQWHIVMESVDKFEAEIKARHGL